MPRRPIILTDQQAGVVEALVVGGRFANPEEVVSEGLRLVASRQPTDAEKREALHAAIQVGLDDLEHGRFVEFDNDEDLHTHLDDLVEDILADEETE